MNQTKYCLQTRSRLPERSELGHRILHAISAADSFYYDDSWEERAFAKDSAGLLGACTWPPKSYTCSFCRREFRSAQALGGHMNVHRRDRARLKQSTSSENDGKATTTDHDNHRSSCKDVRASDSQRISLAYDAEPTSNPSNYTTRVASSLSQSSNTFFSRLSPSSSSETQEKHEAPKNITSPRHELKRDKNHTLREAAYSMPRYPCREDEKIVGVKRQRIGRLFPFLADAASPSTSNILLEKQTEVLKLSTAAVEELDLELRLGRPSNFKAVLC